MARDALDLQDSFRRRAKLVVDALPLLSNHHNFALKGGTAINFFYRDLPRYSVDIDLAYTKIQDRKTTVATIDSMVREVKTSIERDYANTIARPMVPSDLGGAATGLEIVKGQDRIILEVNYVFRGTVTPPVNIALSPVVRELVGSDVTVKALSLEETYGSKLCAALSRQHPRDFFDVKVLLDNEGITPGIKRSFIAYLAGTNRPFHELLSPNAINLEERFRSDFVPMNRLPITVPELLDVRRRLVASINNALTDSDKEFLLTMQAGEPAWSRLDVPNIAEFPAVRWKLANIKKMDALKREYQLMRLEKVLSGKELTLGLER